MARPSIPPPPPTARSNLPTIASSFVGRRDALEDLATLLRQPVRLVTLRGPAGTGKTRLAIELAKQIEQGTLDLGADDDGEHEAGGVWFCDLSDTRTLEGLCLALAQTLDVPLGAASTEAMVAQLGAALEARRSVLLMLDNFEQVVSAANDSVGAWIEAAPRTRFLATSRQRLGVEGERVLDLRPLSVPRVDGEAAASDAVTLFVERARSARPGYELTGEDAPVVAEIVRRLDGLPLAIELAAARMKVLGARQVAEHLARRFDLLAERETDRTARQATLRGALDWSWDLLEPWERTALAQCSVFRGGFDLRAAESVLELGEHGDAPWTLDVVQALLDRSLMHAVQTTAEAPMRYRLYETVIEYAREKLDDEAARAVADRHAEHYLGVVEAAAAQAPGPTSSAAIAILQAEVENAFTAHARFVEAGRAAEAIRVALALEPLLTRSGPVTLRRWLFDPAVDAADEAVPASTLAEGLVARGAVLLDLGEIEASVADRERALEVARRAGAAVAEGRALAALARSSFHVGKLDDAAERFGEAIACLAQAGAERDAAVARSHLANAHYLWGDHERARAEYDAALPVLEATGDVRSRAMTLGNLASLEHELGNVERARQLCREVLRVQREIGDRHNEGCYLTNLGSIEIEQGATVKARQRLDEALDLLRATGNRRWEAIAIGYLAQCDELSDEPDDARDRYREALALHRDVENAYHEGLTLAWLGRLEADEGNLDEARDVLARAEEKLNAIGQNILVTVASLCSGHVALATGERERAERSLAEARQAASGSSEVRAAAQRLEAALAKAPAAGGLVLVVGNDARWFRIGDGERIDISTRRAPRLLLGALLAKRETEPGAALDVADLLAAGWPGERVDHEAGVSRVYTGIATLRKMGLKGVLIRRDEGYLLSPDVRTERGGA